MFSCTIVVTYIAVAIEEVHVIAVWAGMQYVSGIAFVDLSDENCCGELTFASSACSEGR